LLLCLRARQYCGAEFPEHFIHRLSNWRFGHV
jgi:hypothetical protein